MEDIKITLTNNEINDLDIKLYKDCSNNVSKNCVICLLDFEDNDEITLLKCSHCFHKNCIFKWLKNNSNQCPICRKEIAKGKPNFIK